MKKLLTIETLRDRIVEHEMEAILGYRGINGRVFDLVIVKKGNPIAVLEFSKAGRDFSSYFTKPIINSLLNACKENKIKLLIITDGIIWRIYKIDDNTIICEYSLGEGETISSTLQKILNIIDDYLTIEYDFRFEWEGGLSELKDKITSVELQHRVITWLLNI